MTAVNRNLVNFVSKDIPSAAGAGFLRPAISVSGAVADLKMGETVAAGDLLYYKEADKEFLKADSDAIATMPVVAMALEAGSNGAYSKALLNGYVRADFLGLLNRASGSITISGDVSDADSFTIQGVVFSFQTTGDAPAGAVKIDASVAATKTTMQPALLTALKANAVTAAAFTFGVWANDVLPIYAKYPTYVGVLGNALTLVKDGTNLAVSGATLSGGNDGGVAYASGTAGAVTFTKPSGVADVPQIIGLGISMDEMFFAPQIVEGAAPWNRLEADAATVTITKDYDGKVVILDKTDGCTVNLPAAADVLGVQVSFAIDATLATGATINCVIATDDFVGGLLIGNDTDETVVRRMAASGNNKITLAATQGGLAGGKITLTALKTGFWFVEGALDASGSEATPFSTAT